MQVTFYSVAEMRQHNDGPTHRKAVAKDQAMRERNARLGAQSSAAAEAVVSAAHPGHQLDARECLSMLMLCECPGVCVRQPEHR